MIVVIALMKVEGESNVTDHYCIKLLINWYGLWDGGLNWFNYIKGGLVDWGFKQS